MRLPHYRPIRGILDNKNHYYLNTYDKNSSKAHFRVQAGGVEKASAGKTEP
jgi:hypothetical protein